VRVEISADAGASWQDAELLEDLGRWAWRLWRLRVELEPGEHTILTRAWDSAAATQPEHPETVWNPKGYVNSSWGRTRLRAS
jgi:sulfite oxidase